MPVCRVSSIAKWQPCVVLQGPRFGRRAEPERLSDTAGLRGRAAEGNVLGEDWAGQPVNFGGDAGWRAGNRVLDERR